MLPVGEDNLPWRVMLDPPQKPTKGSLGEVLWVPEPDLLPWPRTQLCCVFDQGEHHGCL